MKTRRTGRVTIALLLIVVACAGDRVTSTNPVLAVHTEAWSGDTLAISSASFTGIDTVPVVTVGPDTLVAWRGGFDTALVLLPDTAGDVTLTARLRAGGIASATVTVRGMSWAGPGPVEAFARAPYPFPWPGSGEPTALATHHGRLVLVDYHANTYTALTADTDLWVGAAGAQFPNPVRSATDRRLVSVSHGSGPLEAIPIASGPIADSGPSIPGLTQIHLSRGNWLVSYKSMGLQLITRSPPDTTVYNAKVEGSYVISPRGDRVVTTQTIGGLFAFEPTTPALVFRVGTSYAGGAAFSEGGDTLFAVVHDVPKLMALDATTGATLREVPVWNEELEVVVDPGRPWLYLVGVEGGSASGHIAVYVYDRASLTRIATLVVPDSAVPPNYSAHLAGMYVPILDATRRILYLTMNYYVDPQFVFCFDLMR